MRKWEVLYVREELTRTPAEQVERPEGKNELGVPEQVQRGVGEEKCQKIFAFRPPLSRFHRQHKDLQWLIFFFFQVTPYFRLPVYSTIQEILSFLLLFFDIFTLQAYLFGMQFWIFRKHSLFNNQYKLSFLKKKKKECEYGEDCFSICPRLSETSHIFAHYN